MGIYFNADETFEMAEQIERNGARFYMRAAEATKSPAAQQRFRELAGWELTHEKIFAAMRARLSDEERRPTAYDPESQTTAFLRAMADGRVFNLKADPAGLLSGKEPLAELLRIALGIEKDSIVFYLGMKEMIPARLGREKIDGIIREEMNHIAILSRELATAEQG